MTRPFYPVCPFRELFLSDLYSFTVESLCNFISDAALSVVERNHHDPVALEKVPKSRKTTVDFVQSSEVVLKQLKKEFQHTFNIRKKTAKDIFLSRFGHKTIFVTRCNEDQKDGETNRSMEVKEAYQKLFKNQFHVKMISHGGDLRRFTTYVPHQTYDYMNRNRCIPEKVNFLRTSQQETRFRNS